ncbi:hypothetical protein SAMN02745857_03577 [Andreprevotia lacus DSM 23236]|uniref:Uncharacterized protein n=1 Tax=Andreprevotia lacus DSM 23236 TaxID=1121001 RepID=A0A1W1XYX7_9NEIS|nr:hypothetical protein [Andreprevotia lacus]SMC29075.1 hypothetical protein SAMN02745857_03577 [Andreprevotia lacus DSM 23236]
MSTTSQRYPHSRGQHWVAALLGLLLTLPGLALLEQHTVAALLFMLPGLLLLTAPWWPPALLLDEHAICDTSLLRRKRIARINIACFAHGAGGAIALYAALPPDSGRPLLTLRLQGAARAALLDWLAGLPEVRPMQWVRTEDLPPGRSRTEQLRLLRRRYFWTLCCVALLAWLIYARPAFGLPYTQHAQLAARLLLPLPLLWLWRRGWLDLLHAPFNSFINDEAQVLARGGRIDLTLLGLINLLSLLIYPLLALPALHTLWPALLATLLAGGAAWLGLRGGAQRRWPDADEQQRKLAGLALLLALHGGAAALALNTILDRPAAPVLHATQGEARDCLLAQCITLADGSSRRLVATQAGPLLTQHGLCLRHHPGGLGMDWLEAVPRYDCVGTHPANAGHAPPDSSASKP